MVGHRGLGCWALGVNSHTRAGQLVKDENGASMDVGAEEGLLTPVHGTDSLWGDNPVVLPLSFLGLPTHSCQPFFPVPALPMWAPQGIAQLRGLSPVLLHADHLFYPKSTHIF